VRKFLIIQTAFIGDVVLATSLVEKLHAFFPHDQIDFLVRKGNESLLTGHPFLGRVLVWDKKEHKNRHLWKLLLLIRRQKYDKVITVQRFASTGLLAAFSGASQTVGFDKNPFSFLFSKRLKHEVGQATSAKHEIERNQDLIRDFTDGIVCKPKLYPSVEDFERVRSYKNEKYITISPASVWFTKQYPASKWISFLDSIPHSYPVYLLGAGSDGPLCDGIVRSTRHPTTINLCGKLSFLQSAALMKDSTMNYVNDSAPMHFASAMNAPVTVVYCSTVPAFGFGPLSDEQFIVQIQGPLHCRPCGLHGFSACPQKHFRCALDITDQQLIYPMQQASGK
jgi:ADP-heptose:LPS heptosyltransferase